MRSNSRWNRVALVFALCLAAAASTAAQPGDSLDASPQIGDTILADIAAVGSDALLLFGAPSTFGAADWAIAGGALALGFGSMPLDEEVRDIALRNQGSDGTRIAETANSFGTWWPAFGISSGLYVTGLALDLPAVRVAGRHVAQSVLYAGLVTSAVKAAVGRQRPLFGEGQYVFDPFTLDDRYHSLASGHTTLVFAVASSLSADIDHPAATVALYGLATLTGLSRIYVDRHWASDVILGAAAGTACGYGVAHLHDEADDGSSFIIVPGIDRLTMVWTF
jgi:membrane-associated phospholipid phosphatase